MFEKYIEQVLKIFRYVDSALITDEKGNITRIMRHSSGSTPDGFVIYPKPGVLPMDVFEL